MKLYEYTGNIQLFSGIVTRSWPLTLSSFPDSVYDNAQLQRTHPVTKIMIYIPRGLACSLSRSVALWRKIYSQLIKLLQG